MTRLTILFLWLVCSCELRADGFSFDPETQEVSCPNLRLPLTEDQQLEVSASGHVTFTAGQLELLRRLYPKIPVRMRVVAATHNDNQEDRLPNAVDCYWTAPGEISLTLRPKWGGGEFQFDEGFPDIAKAVKMNADFADIRIAPTGLLYYEGLEISLQKAFEIIKDTKRVEGEPVGEPPVCLITIPPPFRQKDEASQELNQKTRDVVTALQKYGEAAGVAIHKIW